MSIKPHLSRVGWLCVLLSLFACFLLTGLYFFLPFYLESQLIPRLAKDAGLNDISLDIRRIGITGADLADLRIGSSQRQAFSIQSIQIDYSLSGLFHKQVKRIVLSGIELTCDFKPDGTTIGGLDLHNIKAASESSKTQSTTKNDIGLPVAVDRFEVRNASVIANWHGISLRIPLEMSMRPVNGSLHLLDCLLHMYPRDQQFYASAQLDLTTQSLSLNLNAAQIELKRFADFASRIPGVNLSGDVALTANAGLKWSPFKVTSAAAVVNLNNADIVYGNARLVNTAAADGQKLPFSLEVNSSSGQAWTLSGSSFTVANTIPLKVSNIFCSVQPKGGSLEGTGTFKIGLDPVDQDREILLSAEEPLDLQGEFSVKTMTDGRWEFSARKSIPETGGDRVSKFNIAGFNASAKLTDFWISGSGAGAGGSAKYSLKLSEISAGSLTGTLKIPRLSMTGSVSAAGPEPDAHLLGDFNVSATGTHLSWNTADMTLPEFSLVGEVRKRSREGPRFKGTLKVASGRFNDSSLKAAARGISGKIPLEWPLKGSAPKGWLELKSIHWKDINIGSLRASLQQRNAGTVFDGRYLSSLLSGRALTFNGSLGPTGARGYGADFQFALTESQKISAIDLSRILPEVKNLSLNGQLAFRGNGRADRSGVSCGLDAFLRQARVRLPDKEIDVEGLRIEFSAKDMLSLRSGPGQLLSFDRVSLGALKFTDGKIKYQMESPRSILVETLHFKWCDGSVNTQAFRISPGVSAYDLTLYCDRLNLAKLLEQFGAAKAEGRGTVNGKIPVKYTNGQISFDDGFLFSTPGDGGTIRLTGSQVLSAGIPAGTPQYAQIELAREALKNYVYDWAKLNLRTEGENLLLKMQFDGKPLKPLPFVYKKEFGGFVKVETGGKGSTFQGISLDLNFKLPLNEILTYKNLFNMIQGDKE